jgi:simple sugar transport system permease protein
MREWGIGETWSERRAVLTLAAALALLALATALMKPAALSPDNLMDMLQSASAAAIMALGLLVVLIAGGLDVSFTAVASLAQYALAYELGRRDLGWTGALALAGAAGAALGVVNGAIVTGLRAAPIVVTIALLNIYFGALILISRGEMLYGFPDFFATSALVRLGRTALTVQTAALAAAAAATTVLLSATRWGRLLRATGGDKEAARRLGVPILAVNLFAYGYLGLLSGVAGLVQAQMLQAVTPGALVGQELGVVAAAVIGGASLAGGRGTVVGALLGALLLALVGNLLVLNGVSPYWHQALTGGIVLASVALQIRPPSRRSPRSAARI